MASPTTSSSEFSTAPPTRSSMRVGPCGWRGSG